MLLNIHIHLTNITVERRIQFPDVDSFFDIAHYMLTTYVYDTEIRNICNRNASFMAMQRNYNLCTLGMFLYLTLRHLPLFYACSTTIFWRACPFVDDILSEVNANEIVGMPQY